jgi:sec-independent protein translocase protein TatA
MNFVLFAWLNTPEIIAILVVVLILFGAKKLPELARGLGQGIKEFKKASREVTEEINKAAEEETPVTGGKKPGETSAAAKNPTVPRSPSEPNA